MEDDNQEYSLYKLSIDIFRQAIVHLSIKLLQVFIIINTKPSIEIIFNKSYFFHKTFYCMSKSSIVFTIYLHNCKIHD